MPTPAAATAPKKRKKLALGKGLDALIPVGTSEDKSSGESAPRNYFPCDIDQIRPNRFQPRTRFTPEELESLADSIRSQGIIQPLLVRKDGTGYELVAGERRLRAARMAGLSTVPVVVREISDSEMLEMSIVENIQRENFNPIEEAEAYHRLMTEFHLTQDEAATRVGKSRSAVANFLRLRQLSDPIKDTLIDGSLSMGHARALLGLDSPGRQTAAWREVVDKKLSVRQTEALVKRMKAAPAAPKPIDSETAHYTGIENDLSHHFGTKVQIRRQKERGKVEIEFYSDEDLDRVLNLLTRRSD